MPLPSDFTSSPSLSPLTVLTVFTASDQPLPPHDNGPDSAFGWEQIAPQNISRQEIGAKDWGVQTPVVVCAFRGGPGEEALIGKAVYWDGVCKVGFVAPPFNRETILKVAFPVAFEARGGENSFLDAKSGAEFLKRLDLQGRVSSYGPHYAFWALVRSQKPDQAPLGEL